jgi:T-complex protein 1 subunit alpha
MSSKIIGAESDFFSEMALSAAMIVRVEKAGKVKCHINNIHILKCHGLSSMDSLLVEGFALNCARASQGMPTRLTNVKIALLEINLQKQKMQMGVQIVVNDTKQVEEIRQREMDMTRETIQRILSTGAKVVLTTKGIDDLCLKYFVEAGAIAVRRVLKEDIKRIAKATGGQVVSTMADMEGGEAFDAANLGEDKLELLARFGFTFICVFIQVSVLKCRRSASAMANCSISEAVSIARHAQLSFAESMNLCWMRWIDIFKIRCA